jgi:hypothetical protein
MGPAPVISAFFGSNHALAKADHDWLARLITRRVPLESFADAFTARPDDVKVVITLDGSGS